jgi:hypothetical protein
MNKGLLLLALTGTAMLASPAQAVVTVDGTVPAFRVDYIFFSFTGGNLSIATDGFGGTPIGDPEITLLRDNGSALGALTGTIVGNDDDSGPGMNSLLSLVGLSSGSYVLAVGVFDLDDSEARSGIASGPGVAGGYRTTFTSQVDVTLGRNAVPEPATWMTMLFGFGLAGVGLRRRSKAIALA